LNSDGQLDIAVANSGTDNIGLFFGFGNGTFSSQRIYTTGVSSRPSSITVGYLNNDTYLDLAVVTTKTNNLEIFLGRRNGNFPNSTSYFLRRNANPSFIIIADFNNDRKSDITIVYNGTDKIILLIGNDDGTFADPKEYSTGPLSSPYWISVADFNNDDQMHIVVANYNSHSVGIFLGYSDGEFSPQITYSMGTGSYPKNNVLHLQI
jgi:FG-GAP-like repeat